MVKRMSDQATQQAPAGQQQGQAAQKVSYSASRGLAAWLGREKLSLAVSSYQSGRLYLLGANPKGGLMVNERAFGVAMGLNVPQPDTLVLATGHRIVRMEQVLEPDQRAQEIFDGLYVPRVTWTTGALDTHDVGLLPDGRPVFVATGWNCLATASDRHGFAPYWVPPFVTKMVREDRCHLNGMAMGPKGPAFVTAVSKSDTVDGWRDRRGDGGVIMEVPSGKVIASGLSMPHSPRLHKGKLWVLNSGTGELGWINRKKKAENAFEPVAFCPGFTRGLSFHGDLAAVGLSKPRHKRFEGLALDQKLADADSEPWCGVQILDSKTGDVAHWFRIDGAIGEIYDVAVVPGRACPMSISPESPEARNLVTHEPWAGHDA